MAGEDKRQSKRFPSRQPIDIPGGDSWIYENRNSITVVCEKRQNDLYIATTQAVVPLKFLQRIVNRWRRAKAKRRSK